MALPELIDVETFFADPAFSGAQISPDGTRIAYLAPKHGRTNVWIRAVDEDHDRAVCVTQDRRRGVKSFGFAADPRWLLYMQDTDGNEDWHLYRVDLQNPEQPAVDLTPMPAGSRVTTFAPLKSRPGTYLVSMNRRPAFFDAFLVDIGTGETTVHREAPDALGSFLFGPEGQAFYVKPTVDGVWEFATVDESGEVHVFRRQAGPEHPAGVSPVQVDADGRGLLLGSYGDGDDLRLVRVDAATGEETEVVALPGRSLLGTGNLPALLTRKSTGEVLAARFVGDRPVLVPLDKHFAEVHDELSKLSDGVLGTATCDDSGQRWVVSFVHDREPGLTYFYDHATRESRLLFRPYPHLEPADMAPMSAVSLTARDGLPLHAFLTLPVGAEPTGLPLVLVVHGGPWANDLWGFDREVQFLANRGYAVLQVNFRGSSGYGRKHILGAVKELAGKMHDDLIDAADWAVEQGIADPRRIGIYGGSYGGYAALVGVTFTPDYFAAAVDYVGVSNLANFMRSMPDFVQPYLRPSWYAYVGDPADPEDEAYMLARSPISKVDEIRTPLLVVQGANDVRVVKAEADNIVSALTERGVPVEYIVAEDEGHGFANPENLVTMFRAIDRFFAQHLGGRSGEGSPAGRAAAAHSA